MYEPLVGRFGYKIAMYIVSPRLIHCEDSVLLLAYVLTDRFLYYNASRWPVSPFHLGVIASTDSSVELAATSWQMFNGGRVVAYFAVGIVSVPLLHI